MKVLFEGFKTLWDANFTGSDALANKLFLHEAPQSEDHPFAVYYLISGVPDYWFNDEQFEEYVVQVSIFSDDWSSSNVTDYFNDVAAAVDDAALTVTGYTTHKVERENSQLLRDSDNAMWHYLVQYRILLEKN